MDRNLFRYIWRHSRRDQLIIFAVVLAQLPFYFMSLELPKRIVNEAIQGRAFENGRTTASYPVISLSWPDWLGGGGGEWVLFEGFTLDRYGLLFALSSAFLAFVLINGAFKYWINVAKGALGERMLRRMRFDLFGMTLRFTPSSLKKVKSAEVATIIKDEVEPIGGFIGDAFVLPLFLGTQALTALGFIMLQNVWLGLMALAVIAVQFTIIPRLRRELLRLGRERQLASRQLAGRIGEVLEGMELVHVHNAGAWERAEIGHRLFQLFDIRFRIYKRKFMVKFLNNLLAQMTPFFFYAVGGYFALKGTLNIGQLVAVIAAYRDLPPPLKELIDWDQMRLDVQVKYEQVVQFFAAERLQAAQESDGTDEPIAGPLVLDDVRVLDEHGTPILDGATLTLALPTRVVLRSDGGPGASTLAQIIGRRGISYQGRIAFGERDLNRIAPSVLGRHIAYAGVEPVLFPGSLRDNLVYGLRQRPSGEVQERRDRETLRRLAEARRTGNPTESILDEWIDYRAFGLADAQALDDRLVFILRQMDLQDDLYRFGLAGRVDLDRYPDLAQSLVAARRNLRDRLDRECGSDLVERFDPARYNAQATVAENLLFGVPTVEATTGRSLAEHPLLRGVLDDRSLTEPLTEMGVSIAETMTEIFRGIPHGHPLFDQFSFLSADELPEFEALLRHRRGRGRLNDAERTQLLALSLAYVEPRHRLGLLNDASRRALVEARAPLRAALEADGDPGVEFYDPDRICAVAPLRDNLLFGRVNHAVADASAKVSGLIAEVVDSLDLREAVERVGLDHRVGPAGRLLTASQRAAVHLARCLVKHPDILVLDGILAPFGETRSRQLLAKLQEAFRDRTLIAVAGNDADARGFDQVIRVVGGRLEESEPPPALRDAAPSGQDGTIGEAGRRVAAGE